MRQKTYYTVDEITNNLYTMGQEWMTEDHTEYVGLYHRYITGEVYTGKSWDSKTSKELIQYKQIPAEVKLYNQLKQISVKFDEPTATVVQITQQHIDQGYLIRYFIKKINETKILEIDESQYNKFTENLFDTNMYVATKIYWFVSGETADQTVNGILEKGVVSKNLDQIKQGVSKVPGLSNLLADPLQYYTDTSYVIPKDINA